jgi:hypothetical protein
MGPQGFSLGVKWPGHKDDHSSLFSDMLSIGGAIPSLPHVPSWGSQEQPFTYFMSCSSLTRQTNKKKEGKKEKKNARRK